jgi:hypothetical protein
VRSCRKWIAKMAGTASSAQAPAGFPKTRFLKKSSFLF